MTPLPNNLAAVINRINDKIIKDHKHPSNTPLSYFLANGRAFYDCLFMAAMINEVNAEKRGESNASNSKKLQETIDVSTIR